MHKKIIVAAVVGLILGSLSTYGVCRWQRPGDGGAAEHHVRELEERLDRAESIARAATDRAAELEQRSTEAVESIAGIAERVVSITDRSDRMGDLDDRIFAIVEELEAVYLGLTGIPAP